MSYDVLEKKFQSLPQQSFEEVSAFFDYIFYKFGKASNSEIKEEEVDSDLIKKINEACKKHPQERIAQDATVAAMWEAVKNDEW